MASIIDGVKIGVGMFIVLPLVIIIAIILLFTTFATGTLILVLVICLIFYLAAKKYKGEDIVVEDIVKKK